MSYHPGRFTLLSTGHAQLGSTRERRWIPKDVTNSAVLLLLCQGVLDSLLRRGLWRAKVPVSMRTRLVTHALNKAGKRNGRDH